MNNLQQRSTVPAIKVHADVTLLQLDVKNQGQQKGQRIILMSQSLKRSVAKS